MECSCSINAGIDEYGELFSAGWIKGRSTHKCAECNKRIKINEECYRERVKFDGRFTTYKTCVDCISIRRHLCGDWIYGSVREMVSDAIQDGLEIPEKCIAKLMPAARAWVCELIEKEWEREE